MNESKNPTEKIEYLTNQHKFYRLKLAQAAVKIQELKTELIHTSGICEVFIIKVS